MVKIPSIKPDNVEVPEVDARKLKKMIKNVYRIHTHGGGGGVARYCYLYDLGLTHDG